MNLDERIRTALEPMGLPVCPHDYEGDELEYITFVYTELGALHANGAAQAIRYLVDLSWYLPKGQNPNVGKARIRQLLQAAGATTPNIVDASDGDGQHYVFEFEMTGAVPDG